MTDEDTIPVMTTEGSPTAKAQFAVRRSQRRIARSLARHAEIQQRLAQAVAAAITNTAPSKRGMRILLVEDNTALRRALKWTLEVDDHVIDEAGTMADALRLLASERYDHIVLDILLPDGNGAQIARHRRELGDVTPITVLTALDTTEALNMIEGIPGIGLMLKDDIEGLRRSVIRASVLPPPIKRQA